MICISLNALVKQEIVLPVIGNFSQVSDFGISKPLVYRVTLKSL